MPTRITMDEGDLKKVVLLLSSSKTLVQIPPDDLQVMNLWRISGKLVEKILRKQGWAIEKKGKRIMVVPIKAKPDADKL